MNLSLKRRCESIFYVRPAKWPISVGLLAWVARCVGNVFLVSGIGFPMIGLGFPIVGLGCAARVDPGGFSRGAPSAPLAERAARILTHAIQIRTANPPGDERPLAEYYVSLLQQAGIEARVVDTPAGASRVGRAAARLRKQIFSAPSVAWRGGSTPMRSSSRA